MMGGPLLGAVLALAAITGLLRLVRAIPSRRRVRAAATRTFPHEGVATIMGILESYGVEAHERERARVQLAILKLSEGDVDKLLHFVDRAKQDYRDVLMWAEHPGDKDSQAEFEEVQKILKAIGDDSARSKK